MATMTYLEVRIPFSGWTTVQVATTQPLSEEEAIAVARASDAYPDLRQGVLEYAWEDASVHEVQPPPFH